MDGDISSPVWMMEMHYYYIHARYKTTNVFEVHNLFTSRRTLVHLAVIGDLRIQSCWCHRGRILKLKLRRSQSSFVVE